MFILTHPNLYISHPAAPPEGGILQISSLTVGRSRMSPGPPSNVCSPPSTLHYSLPTCRAPPAARRSPSPSTPFAAQSGSLSVDGPERNQQDAELKKIMAECSTLKLDHIKKINLLLLPP